MSAIQSQDQDIIVANASRMLDIVRHPVPSLNDFNGGASEPIIDTIGQNSDQNLFDGAS